MTKEEIIKSLDEVRQKLVDLENEKTRLLVSSANLERQLLEINAELRSSDGVQTSIVQNSSVEEKISLFHGLFSGRQDVFPTRWENRKSGRTGYSPACSNEWQQGICEKSKIKCSECPNQSFSVSKYFWENDGTRYFLNFDPATGAFYELFRDHLTALSN